MHGRGYGDRDVSGLEAFHHGAGRAPDGLGDYPKEKKGRAFGARNCPILHYRGHQKAVVAVALATLDPRSRPTMNSGPTTSIAETGIDPDAATCGSWSNWATASL